MKRINIKLSVAGVNQAIVELKEYKTWLQERTRVFVSRLTEEGFNIASAKFAASTYDGTNDVTATVEDRGDGVCAVVATGSAVLFIEFGTGVTYADNHPQAAELGMRRGEYGKGRGKRSSWGYYGEPGTNGIVKENKNGRAVVITHGNPANMPMYETVKELEVMLKSIAEEVFK